MATFLDISLLENFQPVFIFILLTVGGYAVLNFISFFGDDKRIHAVMAIIVGVLASLSVIVQQFIVQMLPWLVILAMFTVFILVAFKTFGVSDEQITHAFRKNVGIQWAIFIVVFIILLGVGGNILGQSAGPYLGGAETEAQQSADIGSTAGGSSSYKTSNTLSGIIPEGTGAPGSTATPDVSHNVGATIFHPKVLGMLAVLLIGVSAVGLLSSTPYIRQ